MYKYHMNYCVCFENKLNCIVNIIILFSYPTYDEIMARYKEIKKWNEYKTAVVDETEKDLKRRHNNPNKSSISTSPIRTNRYNSNSTNTLHSKKKAPYFPITVNIKK